MFSREDSVVMVTHPSGATVVEHADGTRISSYFKEMLSPVEIKDPETDRGGKVIGNKINV